MSGNEPSRPFDFMVPFWGKRYREYFVDLCLPSLLAPNNIALLRAEDGHRFLMATTLEDWQAIERLPIMDHLRPHATPTLVEVTRGEASPLASGDGAMAQYTAVIRHQTTCLKLLFDEAHRHRSYGCLMSPDHIFSDGTVALMLRCAREGYQFVLCPSLRQKEEAVLADLRQLGYLPPSGEPLSRSGSVLSVPPRVMADMFVRHLHSEMDVFEYAAPKPGRPFIFPFCFWRVPGGRGIILHEFFGVPVLMDFAALPASHTACLERDDYENVYLSENYFRGCDKFYFVQDSDEFNIVSLTPAAADFSASVTDRSTARGWRLKYAQMCDIRDSMRHYVGRNWETVRRDLFLQPFRLHAGELDPTWFAAEKAAARILAHVVGDYRGEQPPPTEISGKGLLSSGWRMALFEVAARQRFKARLHGFTAPITSPIRRAISIARALVRRTAGAISGDPASRQWLSWRLRRLWAAALRRPFHEPRPPTPD